MHLHPITCGPVAFLIFFSPHNEQPTSWVVVSSLPMQRLRLSGQDDFSRVMELVNGRKNSGNNRPILPECSRALKVLTVVKVALTGHLALKPETPLCICPGLEPIKDTEAVHCLAFSLQTFCFSLFGFKKLSSTEDHFLK